MKNIPEIKGNVQDNEEIIVQSSFDGGWMPSTSPLKIGDNNFGDCIDGFILVEVAKIKDSAKQRYMENN